MLRKTRQGRNQDPRICCFSSVSEAGILQLSARVHANSLQSCPSLCNPVDRSPPGSSVHRILQARILEWAATSFSNPQVGSVQTGGKLQLQSCSPRS
jgi:hypothetical protein